MLAKSKATVNFTRIWLNWESSLAWYKSTCKWKICEIQHYGTYMTETIHKRDFTAVWLIQNWNGLGRWGNFWNGYDLRGGDILMLHFESSMGFPSDSYWFCLLICDAYELHHLLSVSRWCREYWVCKIRSWDAKNWRK